MSYNQVKSEILDILKYIIEFYKAPSKAVKKVPHWSWFSLFVLISIFGCITGVLRGVLADNPLQALVGFFFLPATCFIAVFLVTSALYFLIVIFQDRNLNFKRLTTLVFLTLIPALTLYAVSIIHPFITLIGPTVSFFLMYVGLLNRFQLGKKFLLISLGAFYILFLAFWFGQYLNIDSEKKTKDFIELNLKNQEILKKELSE